MAAEATAQRAATRSAGSGGHSRKVLTAMLGNGYPAAIAFLTGPILAHSLGVDGRGMVASATSPLTLITTVATFGLPEAVTYTVARNVHLARHAAARGAALLGAAGALATLALVAAAPVLGEGHPAGERLVLVAALAVVPNLLVGVLRGVASARQAWWLVTAERMTSATLRLAVLVPFWLADRLTPMVATVAIAAMPVAGGLVYARVLGPARDVVDDAALATARANALLGYGLRLWIGSLSGILLSRLDQTLLTPLASSYQLGLYVVAVSVSELPLIINTAVRDVSFVTDAHESADERLATSARLSTAACTAVGLLLGVSMIWGLPALFGADFSAAVPVAAVLLVAVVAGTPGAIAGAGLSARGRPGARSASLVIACACNVLLLVLLAPPYGAMGAALATLVGNLLSSNLNLLFLRRIFGVPAGQFYGLRRSDLAVLRRAAARWRGSRRTGAGR